MQIETYPTVSANNHKTYEFLSKGPQGEIRKVVYYHHLGANTFNMDFGDWIDARQKIDES